MRVGVCVAPEVIADLGHCPADYLEVNGQRFLAPEAPSDVFERNRLQVDRLPIPVEAVNALLPPDMTLISGPNQSRDEARLERYMKTAFDRAVQTGVRVVVFGSGAARSRPPGLAPDDALRQLTELLAVWGEWAQDHGVQLAIEPLRYAETNTVNTVAEGGTLVETIAHPGVTLLADLYHVACNGETPESIRPWVPLLSHVHVAEKQDRAAPGRHGEDFRSYFSVLSQTGYDQRISIECQWQDPATELSPAVTAVKEQWRMSAPRREDK